MKEFLIVIVLVFHFYAACEFSTHLQRLEQKTYYYSSWNKYPKHQNKTFV